MARDGRHWLAALCISRPREKAACAAQVENCLLSHSKCSKFAGNGRHVCFVVRYLAIEKKNTTSGDPCYGSATAHPPLDARGQGSLARSPIDTNCPANWLRFLAPRSWACGY